MTKKKAAPHRCSQSINFGSHWLHIYAKDGEHAVWLNSIEGHFSGLPLAVGYTRNGAIAKASAVMKTAMVALENAKEPHVEQSHVSPTRRPARVPLVRSRG